MKISKKIINHSKYIIYISYYLTFLKQSYNLSLNNNNNLHYQEIQELESEMTKNNDIDEPQLFEEKLIRQDEKDLINFVS